jgi:hypothetical protein
VNRVTAIFLCRLALAAGLLLAVHAPAVTTGPTIRLDYGHGTAQTNPMSGFLYFVPLIASEPVTVVTRAGHEPGARVMSFRCQTNGGAFKAVCEFEMVGSGTLENIFDHAGLIQRRLKKFQDGGRLARQLSAINVAGVGHGAVEVAGVLTNGRPVVNEVRLRFNLRGQASPVTALLEDIVWRDGAAATENELVARVTALTFRRTDHRPQMEVTVDSIKRKGAGSSGWQNFWGSLKGSVANLFVPPLDIEPEGQRAMLDFGLALVRQRPEFTFPFASRLKRETFQAEQIEKI